MTQSQNILLWLRQLADLDAIRRQKKAPESDGLQQQIDSLRGLIPTSILGHYDRFQGRGKLGMAPVRNGVCGCCHLAIPRGHVFQLHRADSELHVCDNCGAFIYLDDEERKVPNQASAGTASTDKKKTMKRTARRAPKGQ